MIQAFFGTEGIMRFDQGGIDLVLLDIMLPWEKWGSGFKSHQGTRVQNSVIMLTALSDKKLISPITLDGANDYIVQTF